MKQKKYLGPIRFETKSRGFAGFVILTFGLIFCGFEVYKSFLITKSIATIRDTVNTVQSQLSSKKPSFSSSDNPEQTEILDKIKKQNNYAWDQLFSTLEAVHANNVSLMAVQPNIEKKEVLISAETADVHQMLEYTRALGTQRNIDHVELVSQETFIDNQQEKIRFLVTLKLL